MARHLSFIMLGIILVFSCTDAWALNDKDHTRFLKSSPAYADADRRLNEVWRELKTTLPKEDYSRLLEEQRAWVKNGRDREAAAAKGGLAGADAYAATTMRRADVLAERYGLRQSPPPAATREPAAASGQRATPPSNVTPALAATPGVTPALSSSKQVTLTGTVETFREAAMWWARLHTGQGEPTHIGALGEIPEGALACLREAEEKKQTVTVRAIADAKGFIDGQSVECIAANAGKQNNRAPQTHRNSIGMEFVLIPAESFEWEAEVKTSTNDFGESVRTVVTPARKVTISKPFYLGKYEVTQEEWVAVMGTGNNPAKFKGRKNPVEQVSWNDAQEFIRRLNARAGHNRYRLPTEAEWELAARGGTSTRWFFGDNEYSLGLYAWFDENSGETTHPVGQKSPNQYGLYDIYGNVFEWVQDWYDVYPKTAMTDPKGPAHGSYRVRRGGSWSRNADRCRSGDRYSNSPDYRFDYVGFRLALSPE